VNLLSVVANDKREKGMKIHQLGSVDLQEFVPCGSLQRHLLQHAISAAMKPATLQRQRCGQHVDMFVKNHQTRLRLPRLIGHQKLAYLIDCAI
jgi:hypothetical protein